MARLYFTLNTTETLPPVWPAVGRGRRWSGWMTPIVTEPTARAVLARLDRIGAARTIWHNDGTATVYDPVHPRDPAHAAQLSPGRHPLAPGQVTYDLAPLKIRFEEAQP